MSAIFRSLRTKDPAFGATLAWPRRVTFGDRVIERTRVAQHPPGPVFTAYVGGLVRWD